MHFTKIKLNSLIDRMDSNFYVSRAEAIEDFEKKYNILGEISDFPRAKTPPREVYFKRGIPVIKLKNVTEYFLQMRDTENLPEDYYNLFFQPKFGDILVTATGEGTIGRVCLFVKDIKCIVTGEVMVIRSLSENPYFLFAYLRSSICRYQLERYVRGSTGQTHLYSKDVALIPIPKVSEAMKNKAEVLIKKAIQKKEEAENLYRKAKKTLYSMLGIVESNLEERKIFNTRAKGLLSNMRFDSEFFHPKYEEIKESIKNSEFKYSSSDKILNISKETIKPQENPTKIIKYVALADINSNTGEIETFSKIPGYAAPSRARMLIKKGDVLVSSLAGSLDNIAIVPEYLDGEVASTGFFVINSDQFLSEFLFFLFRSDIVKKQLEQKTAGAIMPAVPKTLIGSLIIPIIEKKQQKPIADLIEKYLKLCNESRLLLDEASAIFS
jgi:type I restriction enzyme, S subunit